jgi:hypothetical protein
MYAGKSRGLLAVAVEGSISSDPCTILTVTVKERVFTVSFTLHSLHASKPQTNRRIKNMLGNAATTFHHFTVSLQYSVPHHLEPERRNTFVEENS